MKISKRLAALMAGIALAGAAIACSGDDKEVASNQPLPNYGATIGARVSTPAPGTPPTPSLPPPTVQAPPAVPPPTQAPAPAPPPPTQAPPAAAAAPAPVSLNVTISNFSFAPNPITVRANQQLTLNVTNQDAAPHTLTVMGGGGSTGNIAGNGRGSVTFTRPTPGQVQFFCEVHGATRMSGTITILP